MVDVVLLTPPLTSSERMGGLGAAGAVMPGLGILYLAAQLRDKGIGVAVLDAEGLGLCTAETVNRLEEMRPRVLGITATTLTVLRAGEIAAAMRERLPEVCIVLGGPHVTALPGESLKALPAVDCCVIGEGELSFSRIVENVLGGGVLHSGVRGAAWREDGAVRLDEDREVVVDLDDLPFPAWDLLDGFPRRYRPPVHSYRRLPLANVITSRGCPYKCTFCDRSVTGDRVRSHSAPYVADMVELLADRFGVREVSFKDDTFVADRKLVRGVTREFRSRGLDVTWSCNARVNLVTPEMLATLREAGCWLVAYGIESGSQPMLDKMCKRISLDQVRSTLEMTRRAGLVSKGFFLLGVPGETLESMEETLSFVQSIDLDELNVNLFTPFPGSSLYEKVLSEGFEPDYSVMNMVDASYVPSGLEAEDLRRYQGRIIRAFYLRPGKIARYVRRGLGNVDESRRLLRMAAAFASLAWASFHSRGAVGTSTDRD